MLFLRCLQLYLPSLSAFPDNVPLFPPLVLFLLVSQPVYVHPPWVPMKGSFDIHRFILRVMAIDFQNRRRAVAAASGPSVFTVSDTQSVVQVQGYHAYVHHLLLPDARARGHSRPVCICYVTPHEDKPTALFAMLRRYFSKVAELLKLGAYQQFIKDVEDEIEEVTSSSSRPRSSSDVNSVTDTPDGLRKVGCASPSTLPYLNFPPSSLPFILLIIGTMHILDSFVRIFISTC